MEKNNPILLIIVALIIVGLGFFGGMQYQKRQKNNFPTNLDGRFPRASGHQRLGNGANFRPVNGEVSAIDENTITLKTADGGSKIIIYSGSTKINKTSEGSIDDIKTGDKIMVMGIQDSEGRVTAQSISIGNNLFLGRPGQGQPSQPEETKE